MNRRQLFQGLGAVAVMAALPAVVTAEPEKLPTLPPDMSRSQYQRLVALYGDWYVYGHTQDGDYWVGYDSLLGWVTERNTEGKWERVPIYRDWKDRPQHMYAGMQNFHGNSWEAAIYYAETYKKWLEYHDPEGKWMRNPGTIVERWYGRESDMTRGPDDYLLDSTSRPFFPTYWKGK
jgi:hypothetical protein